MEDKTYYEKPRQAQRTPHFDFHDLPPSERLTYQLLTHRNYQELYHLFRDDPSEFVDTRFKTLDALRDYVDYQMEYAFYSAKRGGCDWFFLKDGQYAGVLHLYDLSRETFGNRDRWCTIGFASGVHFRRQGLTQEAVRHLLGHLFGRSFDMLKVQAYTRRENQASFGLLQRIGFENNDAAYQDDETEELSYRYFLMRREQFVLPA